MVAVDLRLPPLLLKRLRILAKSEGREWPELVRTALADYLRRTARLAPKPESDERTPRGATAA